MLIGFVQSAFLSLAWVVIVCGVKNEPRMIRNGRVVIWADLKEDDLVRCLTTPGVPYNFLFIFKVSHHTLT